MTEGFYLPPDVVYECIAQTYCLRDVFHWRLTCHYYRGIINHLPRGYTRALVLRRLDGLLLSWSPTNQQNLLLFGSFLLQVVLGECWPGSSVDVLVEPPHDNNVRYLKYEPYLGARLRHLGEVYWYYIKSAPATNVLPLLDFNLNRIHFDGTCIKYDGDWAALLRKEGTMRKMSVASFRAMMLGEDDECSCELGSKSPSYLHSSECNREYEAQMRIVVAERKALYEQRGFFIDRPRYFKNPIYRPTKQRKRMALDNDGFWRRQ